MSESDLYAELILEATKLGHRLFRNNRGTGKYTRRDGTEGFVPFGLAAGASDLIGWTRKSPRVFAPIECSASERALIDRILSEKIAVLTAIEVKKPGARTNKKRLQEQTDFINAVKAAGGIAGFVTSVADYRALVGAE